MKSPELCGYPMETVIELHGRGVSQSLLPFIDDYELSAGATITGNVYGMPGLKDGTVVTTGELDSIEDTLPSYARTKDRKALYELGEPKSKLSSLGLSSTVSPSRLNLKNLIAPAAAPTGGALLGGELGAITAITGGTLTAAALIGSLSHHLTVNVFWV